MAIIQDQDGVSTSIFACQEVKPQAVKILQHHRNTKPSSMIKKIFYAKC